MITQWYENPHATSEQVRAAATPEGARQLLDNWPQEVHDALAKYGMHAHVSEGRGGYAAVRIAKWLGDWPKQVFVALEFNPALCDLPRLALLGELDELLALWGAAMDCRLEAEMERLLAEESSPAAGGTRRSTERGTV